MKKTDWKVTYRMIPFTWHFEKGKTLWGQKSDQMLPKAGSKGRGLIIIKGHEETFGGDGNILHFGCGGDYDYTG